MQSFPHTYPIDQEGLSEYGGDFLIGSPTGIQDPALVTYPPSYYRPDNPPLVEQSHVPAEWNDLPHPAQPDWASPTDPPMALPQIPSPSNTTELQDPGNSCGDGSACVPQREYQARDPVTGYGIEFVVPDRRGIPVKHAIDEIFDDLDGRDDPMLIEYGTAISIRIEWPGYPSWSRQIKTQDFCKDPNPIKRSKLAKEVAKALHRFFEVMENHPQSDPEENFRWSIGPGCFEKLSLVSLTRHSKASFQPHFHVLN